VRDLPGRIRGAWPLPAITLAALVPLAVPAAAWAAGPGSTGVGIQASDVCLSTPARPGGSYQLARRRRRP